jgi:HlyD family secretion protein
MDESEIAPMQPARVLRVLVREGDRVRAGDTVAICTIPTLSASASQAEARLAAARELAEVNAKVTASNETPLSLDQRAALERAQRLARAKIAAAEQSRK